MRRASDIRPELPDWLVRDRIPKKAVTLIVGNGGMGKSTPAVDYAAKNSLGLLTGKPEPSLLALQQDDEAAVTIPRLMVAKANRKLVHVESEPAWRFPRDLERLSNPLYETKAYLVVIDPLDASVPGLGSQGRLLPGAVPSRRDGGGGRNDPSHGHPEDRSS